MTIKPQNFISNMQIWTVPQLKKKHKQKPIIQTQDEPRNLADDYQEYKNQEIKELKNK